MKKAYSGHYSGTLRDPILVMNDDGEAFSAMIYRSIDRSNAEGAALFSSLINQSLNRATCPNTGKSYQLASPIVIHDANVQRFALYIPSPLRHLSFDFRKDLLAELQKSTTFVPAYVTHFSVIFDPHDFDEIPSLSSSEILDSERTQLAEVRERIDREREHLNEAKKSHLEETVALQEEINQFELQKQSLELEKLQIQQKAIQQSHFVESEVVESTQIVTDDQFLEIFDEQDASPELLAEASDFVEIEEDFDIAPTRSGFPITLSSALPHTISGVRLINNEVVAMVQPSSKMLKEIQHANSFFIQLHVVKEYPIVSLMLAKVDEKGTLISELSWPLDPFNDRDRVIIDRIKINPRLRIGLYNKKGSLDQGFKIQAPLGSNVEWMIEKIDAQKFVGNYSASEAIFLAPSFERLGSMKHGFEFDSFEKVESPSAAKLAAGIVGYWSTQEMFEYLITNRSFPLHQFRRIQNRAIRGASEFGICLNEALRKRAVEIGVASGERALIQLMFANFAEVSVALKTNDLDPTDQWENWDALLTVGEQLGILADSDVVELAEASLKRAKDFQETESQNSGKDLSIEKLFDNYKAENNSTEYQKLEKAFIGSASVLLPLLTRAIKLEGTNEKYVSLLCNIDHEIEGTIRTLLKDRSKNLREAAKLARKRK